MPQSIKYCNSSNFSIACNFLINIVNRYKITRPCWFNTGKRHGSLEAKTNVSRIENNKHLLTISLVHLFIDSVDTVLHLPRPSDRYGYVTELDRPLYEPVFSCVRVIALIRGPLQLKGRVTALQIALQIITAKSPSVPRNQEEEEIDQRTVSCIVFIEYIYALLGRQTPLEATCCPTCWRIDARTSDANTDP